MRLLVSVSDAIEAAAALRGGADIIDAKDPTRGTLGAVSPAALARIRDAIGGARPLTAALGDAVDAATAAAEAVTATMAGASMVKMAVTDAARVSTILASAVASAPGRVIAVAYADVPGSADAILDGAARAGAAGVLLDTANKDGPGLCTLWSAPALTHWVERAHRAGLLAAVAGKLSRDDLTLVRGTGADVAGVRGAACDGGRLGRVSDGRVRDLLRSCKC